MTPFPNTNAASSTAGTNSNGNSFTEYKLKMSPMAVSHNVMMLQSSTVTLAEFSQPIRMVRDPSSALINPDSTNSAGHNRPPPGTGMGVDPSKIGRSASATLTAKKRTRIIFQGDGLGEEEEEEIREAEASPWLLEDYDGQHSFLGKLEGGQSSNYVFFVNQGDEFRIIPVNKWYRFHPKLSYHTLTIEEAETQMNARSRDNVDRWLMKHLNSKNGGSGSRSGLDSPEDEKAPAGHGSNNKLRLAERVVTAERRGQIQLKKQRVAAVRKERASAESLDFDEIFDDDEGNDNFGGLDEDAPRDEEGTPGGATGKSNAASSDANYRLSNEGKVVKKIVKHLDKTNDIIYASDDENDPYASDKDDDEEDDYDFDKLKGPNNGGSTGGGNAPNQPQAQSQPPLQQKKPQAAQLKTPAPSTSRAASPPVSLAASPTPSRMESPAGSPSKRPINPSSSSAKAAPSSKKSKIVSAMEEEDEDNVIREAELIGYLRQGPLSTKDLITKFKRQLKADSKNKDVFRDLVRKVAMVRPSPTNEDDKLLELKPEFK